MSSNYQMYVKQGYDAFRFPVLPEKVEVSYGSNNDKLQVCGIGEVTIIQDDAAARIKLESFFPKNYFPGCDFFDIPNPVDACNKILSMKKSRQPVRFTITGGLGVSMYVTIEDFKTWEEGGDVGTIYFSISLKEYKEVTVRQITVNVVTKKARISSANSRVDSSTSSQTYTVKLHDCLYSIARQFYGDGSKYTLIYNANKSAIGPNPNNINVGLVLTIPGAGASSSANVSNLSPRGSKSNPPYAILTKSYGVVKAGFSTWNSAYNYYLQNEGISKGWKIFDKNRNTVSA